MMRVGVLGVGNLGQHHARIWAGLEGCTLVGCAAMGDAVLANL